MRHRGRDADQYTYYCDAAAKQTFSVDGAQVELRPHKRQGRRLPLEWTRIDPYTAADAASRTGCCYMWSGAAISRPTFLLKGEWKAYPPPYISMALWHAFMQRRHRFWQPIVKAAADELNL